MKKKKKSKYVPDPRIITNFNIRTPDNWCPTVGGVVQMHLLTLTNRGEMIGWRVCLWGGDDFGMEYDVSSYEEAKGMFDLIAGQDFITIEDLNGMGFRAA